MGLKEFMSQIFGEGSGLTKAGSSQVTDMVIPETGGIEINHGFLRIDKPYFFGQCSHSPNGKFVLGWADSDFSRGVGGARDEGLGSYVLLKGSQIVLTGKMERPNDGKVSDLGRFILSDWMFGNKLNGTFYAVSAEGDVLIKKKFEANLDPNNALSNDGPFALCQTCVSDNEEDSCVLTIFDLDKRIERSRFTPVTGTGSECRFDGTEEIIHVLPGDGRDFRYTFDGVFLDQEQWEKERPNYASGYQLIENAALQLEGINSSELDSFTESIATLKRALSLGVSEYYQARIHRLLGEVYHKCGSRPEAIEHLETALRLNPKIGVKKLLKSIRTSP